MKSLKCDEVLDFIDYSEFERDLPLEIKNHLEECKDCKKYYELSRDLRVLSKVKKVDLRGEFLNRLKKRSFNLKLVVGFSIVFVVIVSVLWFKPFDFTNGYSSRSSSSEVSDSLDYYYTIAREM
ncbi:MAG: hypothetical protein ACP5Q5_01755 [Brevinematia bacterium]